MGDLAAHINLTFSDIEWACPSCRHPVVKFGTDLRCHGCGSTFTRDRGIWNFLTGGRARHYAAFLERYADIRREDGWGSDDAGYYRRLPAVPIDDPNRSIWHMRARSFRLLVDRILSPMERTHPGSLRIGDVGAGNAWLANRLAARGHRVVAVDLHCDERDGLGAHRHYDSDFACVRAEFDHLPFEAGSFDLLIFNASLHYSTHLQTTVREALRVLRSAGTLVVMDSPLYRQEEDGARMVRQRADACSRLIEPGMEIPACIQYLTTQKLIEVREAVGVAFSVIHPHSRLRWTVRRLRAAISSQHRPARFPILVSEKPWEPVNTGDVPRKWRLRSEHTEVQL